MTEEKRELAEFGNKVPSKWFAEWEEKHGYRKSAAYPDIPVWLSKEIERMFEA